MGVCRKFLVLDSSNLPMNVRFDGQVLEFIRDLPELGQVLLKQPHGGGTVALDYDHVQEQDLLTRWQANGHLFGKPST